MGMMTSMMGAEPSERDAAALERRDLKALLTEYERDLIRRALEATGGNQRQAARRLGVLPTTLNEKMKRLGLRTRPEGDEPGPWVP
jgi:DNA-binding NtrC family response regulator